MEKVRNKFLEFNVSAGDDPDWYANIEIGSWANKNPEAYQYLMEKSTGAMRIHRFVEPKLLDHVYRFSVEMSEQDWAYYYLRFDDVSRYK